MKTLILACAIALSSCSIPGSSDLPNLNDAASVKTTILKLDPIAPGGPPNDTGPSGAGQPGSDRSLFIGWLLDYAAIDEAHRMDIDYKPAPLPASVAAAIQQQRARDERERVNREAEHARIWAEQRASHAREEQALRESEERLESESRLRAEQDADRTAINAKRADEYHKCMAESLKAQASGSLEDQARIYQSFNCERFLGPAE